MVSYWKRALFSVSAVVRSSGLDLDGNLLIERTLISDELEQSVDSEIILLLDLDEERACSLDYRTNEVDAL